MSRTLAVALLLTDLAFLSYWAVSAMAAEHLFSLPDALLYADYHAPLVVAWNWSFLPLDMAFSACGLAAIGASKRGNPVWRPLALVSLTLTAVAGGMAIAYWMLLGEFDPAWFLPNLVLFVWPCFFLPGLVRRLAQPA